MKINLFSLPVLSALENVYIRLKIKYRGDIKWRYPDRPKILYVVKRLDDCGGVETRLLQYADELTRRRYNIAFVTESNSFAGVKKYPCLHLNFHTRKFEDTLLAMMAQNGIDTVELQIKNRSCLYRLNPQRMRRHARYGCCIHSNIKGLDPEMLNDMDYRVIISDRLWHIDYEAIDTFHVLPVSIAAGQRCWRWQGQSRALIISRIRHDKYRQIESFVNYCRAVGTDFRIGGSLDSSGTVRRLKKHLGLKKEHFIGRIDNTVDYLTRHAGEYAFVAGVGQVILEAGSLGYPCFVCSELGTGFSTFVTRRNLCDDFGRNFTLAKRKRAERIKKVSVFRPETAEDYDISGFITEKYGLAKRFDVYEKLINKSYRNK